MSSRTTSAPARGIAAAASSPSAASADDRDPRRRARGGSGFPRAPGSGPRRGTTRITPRSRNRRRQRRPGPKAAPGPVSTRSAPPRCSNRSRMPGRPWPERTVVGAAAVVAGADLDAAPRSARPPATGSRRRAWRTALVTISCAQRRIVSPAAGSSTARPGATSRWMRGRGIPSASLRSAARQVEPSPCAARRRRRARPRGAASSPTGPSRPAPAPRPAPGGSRPRDSARAPSGGGPAGRGGPARSARARPPARSARAAPASPRARRWRPRDRSRGRSLRRAGASSRRR